jgi:hypothetical protein
MISLSRTLRPFGYLAIGAVSACLLGDLLGRPASAQGTQATLEARMVRLEQAYAALQSQHTQLVTDHQRTTATVAALAPRVDAMQSELKAGVAAMRSELKAGVATMNAGLQASISVADWQLVKGQLSAIGGQLTGATNQIRALQTAMGPIPSGSNASNLINALTLRVAASETNVNALGPKLDTLIANTNDMARRLYRTCIAVGMLALPPSALQSAPNAPSAKTGQFSGLSGLQQLATQQIDAGLQSQAYAKQTCVDSGLPFVPYSAH